MREKHEFLKKKLRASEGRGVGEWDRLEMCGKEGTYCTVHWVLYTTNEASETRDVLYGD